LTKSGVATKPASVVAAPTEEDATETVEEAEVILDKAAE